MCCTSVSPTATATAVPSAAVGVGASVDVGASVAVEPVAEEPADELSPDEPHAARTNVSAANATIPLSRCFGALIVPSFNSMRRYRMALTPLRPLS